MLSWVSYIERSKKFRKEHEHSQNTHPESKNSSLLLPLWLKPSSPIRIIAIISRLLSPWLPTIKSNIATGETLLKHRLITVLKIFQGFPVTKDKFQWPICSHAFSFPPPPFTSDSLPPAAAAKSLQSCPTLCDPRDGSPLGSSVPGNLQARILEWVAISFSNAWKWKVKGKSLSRVWLLANPWTAAY